MRVLSQNLTTIINLGSADSVRFLAQAFNATNQFLKCQFAGRMSEQFLLSIIRTAALSMSFKGKKSSPIVNGIIWSYLIIFFFLSFPVNGAELKKCLFVMSYHQGYEWNDGIEKGVTETLADVCELKKIYLDTKRHTSTKFGETAGKKTNQIMSKFQPNIVIASDDNATKYFVQPYLKDHKIPVVFSGINWTAREYGYPYSNATGMVEVAPIIPLLKNIQRSIKRVKNAVYLSSDVITEHKDFVRYHKEYLERGVLLKGVFVNSMEEWKIAYSEAQNSDFIIVNNNAGINNWNPSDIVEYVKKNSRTLTVTNYRWMMPYAMLGMTKSAIEQGVWAGETVKAILGGMSVKDIPISINKRWNLYVNENLLDAANLSISNRLLNRAFKTW